MQDLRLSMMDGDPQDHRDHRKLSTDTRSHRDKIRGKMAQEGRPVPTPDEVRATYWKQEEDWYAWLQEQDASDNPKMAASLRNLELAAGRGGRPKRAIESIGEENLPRLAFSSIWEACRELSVSPNAIRRALKEGTRCLGMRWRFQEDTEKSNDGSVPETPR